MPNIRYVCLSDLHLGATNSLLTHLDADGAPAPGPAPVLEAVLDGLRGLLAASGTSAPPTLVIHGDLFELALTSVEVAAATFAQLVTIGWGDPSGPLFARDAHFVPGNHDHHMWELMREHDFEAALGPSLADLRPMRHVTPMLASQVPSTERDPLVESLARMALVGRDVPAPSFDVAYPNLGLVDDAGARAVVITHGHYVEPMYRAMSFLHDLADPARPPTMTIDEVEADNWAWIDFFWSTMGRSGEDGQAAVPILYELLQDEEALETLVSRAVDDFLPLTASPIRVVERMVLRRLGRRAAGHASRRERHTGGLLSPAATEGLATYLSGPVRNQLLAEVGHVPEHVELVFGHTHKPFATASAYDGFADKVVVHNTGGWVVDSVEPEPLKGAAVTLISDELEVVGLCVYRQQAGSRRPRVGVMAVPGAPAGPTPLRDWLVDALRRDDDVWSTIAAIAADTVRARQAQLDARIARGTDAIKAARAPGPRGW